MARSGYRSVKNKLLTKVDLPNPDSPTTISVNSKPFFTDLRCTWFGKLAKPTNPGDSTLLNCKKKKLVHFLVFAIVGYYVIVKINLFIIKC